MTWGFFDVFLAIFCGILGGLSSYLLTNWVHLRVSLGLDYRLSDLEARVNREVKVRASEASRSNKHFERDLLEKMQMEKPAPQLSLQSWREAKFKVN